jgi:death-on-curing protein
MKLLFLSLDKVLELHQDQLNRYGGSPGIRDMGLLQSAVAIPQASFGGEFLHEDLYAMGAAYLFHLVQNHAFVDGNKRVGLAAMLSFLDMNSIEFIAEGDDVYEMVLRVAKGELDKADIAEFLRNNSHQSNES